MRALHGFCLARQVHLSSHLVKFTLESNFLCDIAEGSEDVAAFHGIDDDGSALSIKVKLKKDSMAEVWMVWKDEVRLGMTTTKNIQ